MSALLRDKVSLLLGLLFVATIYVCGWLML